MMVTTTMLLLFLSKFTSLSLLPRLFPSPSLSLPSVFPSLLLVLVGPLNTASESGGAMQAPAAGSEANPQQKSIFFNFSLN